MTDRLRPSLGRGVFGAGDEGRLGELKAIVVDQPPRRITALQVGGSKRSATFVDWSAVIGFGPDAVVISGADAVRDARDDREQATAKGSLVLLGTRIVDTAGFERGTVTEVRFDTGTGELVEIEGGDQRWTADQLRTLGGYALVVDA